MIGDRLVLGSATWRTKRREMRGVLKGVAGIGSREVKKEKGEEMIKRMGRWGIDENCGSRLRKIDR